MSEEKTKLTRKPRITKPKKEEANTLSPKEYFEYVKSKKNSITPEELERVYDNTLKLIKRYQITGQEKAIKKLAFLLECIELEFQVVKAGYTQFVYRWDLEEYIEDITDKSIRIIEMKNYEREFPDEVIDEIIKAKEIFGDNLYVVFTDYSGKEGRKIAKERREKDPILFGGIEKDNAILDRLYYICDWVDETCDLTLDQLAKDYEKIHKDDGKRLLTSLEIPESLEDLKRELGIYKESKQSKSGYASIDSSRLSSNSIITQTMSTSSN